MPVIKMSQPNFLFIHIPKTGGKAVREAFGQQIRAPKSKGKFPKEWLELDVPIIAFVRHPYDRLVSAWKMFRDGVTKYDENGKVMERRVPALPEITLDGFVTRMFSIDDRAQPLSVTEHTLPMTDPYNLLEYAQHVGRYETLQEDFDKMCAVLRVMPRELTRVNVSNNDTPTAEAMSTLTDKNKDRILFYYETDMETLGYE